MSKQGEQIEAPMNIKTLRTEMVDVFKKLKAEQLDVKHAKELSNASGKIIATLTVQLKYTAAIGEVPNIEFLNVGESTKAFNPLKTPEEV